MEIAIKEKLEVIYVSCFMHYEQFRYEPQIVCCDMLPQMVPSNILYDITLQTAIEFIANNWNDDFSAAFVLPDGSGFHAETDRRLQNMCDVNSAMSCDEDE